VYPPPVTTRVGTFGGYKGRAIELLPQGEGLLTCSVDGPVHALRLFWSFGESPQHEIATIAVPGAAAPEGRNIPGWVTLVREAGQVRALLSRAFPAIRIHHQPGTIQVRTNRSRLLGVDQSGPRELPGGVQIGSLNEPWLLFFGAPGDEDAPLLLTFTRRVQRVTRRPDGWDVDVAGAGAVQAMPLEGILRRKPQDTPIDHWIACARAWVAPLLAFPIGLEETARIDDDRVSIDQVVRHESISDEYGNVPLALSPLPPSVVLAEQACHPIQLPANVVRNSAQLNLPTFYGPFVFVEGRSCSYSIPAPAGLRREARPRSRSEAATAIRKELCKLADWCGDPPTSYVDAGLRRAAFLAEALPELEETQHAAVRAFVPEALRIALETLRQASEPITGQAWWTIDNTWRAYYPEGASDWAKDNERFDSEFYNGQALAAMEAASAVDPGLVRKYAESARQLFVYDELFTDWATGSVQTQATGEASNLDGAQFAYEGMIAMARMAKLLGDASLRDAAVLRAARQQVALLAMWEEAAWVKGHDYVIGHLSKKRLPASEAETRGPVDAFVEAHGASTLQLESFWQCSNMFFYANRPLFELYRRFGLIDRLRTIEYELMPRLHEKWLDGNAQDPNGENGQPLYGASWTAAHLHARASLFGGDPSALFGDYLATAGTEAASSWYRMQLPEIGGPLMLALLERLAEQGDASRDPGWGGRLA